MTDTNPTPTQPETLPDRIWVWTEGPHEWHDTKTAESDVEYVRAAGAGPQIDRDLIKNIVNAVSLCVEKVEGGCSLNVKNADERVAEVLFNAATSSPTPAPPLSVLLATAGIKCIHDVPEGLSCAICGPVRNDNPRACSKCSHYNNTDPRGRCIETQYDPAGSLVYCGCKCEFTAPPERTQVAGEQSYSEGFDDAARVSRVLNNVTSDSARRAAEEIVDHLIAGPYVKSGRVKKVAEIISKHLVPAPADDDAESLPPQAQLPSPAQQALQIVTAWRAVVGGDDLLIHYIKQAIEENCATTTTKGDR